MMESSGMPKSNKTGFRGVRWDAKQKQYRAMCQVDGVRHELGYFDDVLDAGCAASDFRLKHGITK